MDVESSSLFLGHITHNNNATYKISHSVIPCVVILTFSAIFGTFGNILILLVTVIHKELHTLDKLFITNLALSDLFVTCVAVPLSITAKIEGKQFFDQFPGLCRTIASLCTISCVTSLMTIAIMSINRYIYICTHEMYERIFTKWNCIFICMSVYLVGILLVLLNIADIGDHGFDHKSIECIWDRMASYSYTVVFSITLVWIPSLITGICYFKIYLYVRSHRRRIQQHNSSSNNHLSSRSIRLAKTLFIIFAVFVTCWAPYALLIVLDSKDTFAQEIHVYITMFAHLHPSLNWLIYYLTNKKFTDAYNELLCKCILCSAPSTNSVTNQNHADPKRGTNNTRKSIENPNNGMASDAFMRSCDFETNSNGSRNQNGSSIFTRGRQDANAIEHEHNMHTLPQPPGQSALTRTIVVEPAPMLNDESL